MHLDVLSRSYPSDCEERRHLETLCHRLHAVWGPLHGDEPGVALINLLAVSVLRFPDGFLSSDDGALRRTVGYEMAATAAAVLVETPRRDAETWYGTRLQNTYDDEDHPIARYQAHLVDRLRASGIRVE